MKLITISPSTTPRGSLVEGEAVRGLVKVAGGPTSVMTALTS
ncbi:MAG: hypothetical protein ACRDFS_00640 [Chloroflexota bacterium]